MWFRTLIGIGIVVGLVLLLAGPVSLGERSVRFGPFEIRTGVAVVGAALLVMTVGLIWLFRIVRAQGRTSRRLGATGTTDPSDRQSVLSS